MRGARFGALAVVLTAAGASPCVPAELVPFTAKGSTARGLTLSVAERSSVLKEGDQVVWTLPVSAFAVVFAPDDSWVAFSPGMRSETLQWVPTRAGAKPVSINLVGQLSRDERTFLTFSSCGLQWFSGWKATPQGLEVYVGQNGQARPTERAAPGITFLVGPDGTVARQTPELKVDVVALAETWKGPASDAREGIVGAVHRLSSTETGGAQAARLGPFLKRLFGAADARPSELDLGGRLVGLLSPAEQKEVGALALTRPGAETGLLWGLKDEAVKATFAAQVFRDSARSGRARATAVRVATGDGSAPYGALLKAALTDPDPEVRDTAGDNLARGKCDPAALTDVLAVLRTELDRPTVVPQNQFAHVRLVEHYQRTIDLCLRDGKDPAHAATVSKAVDGGLRFDPEQYSTPELYLALIAWAEQGNPASVPALLDLAEASSGAQKYGHGEQVLPRVIQWRVLRALKARDKKTAAAQLARLDPKSRNRVPSITVADVGAAGKFAGREETVSEFVKRMKPLVK